MKSLFLTLCLLQISWGVVDKTWWKHTTIYQVFLPSFMDGDGDGMGDIKGLTSKLDHIVDMGIETIYINPHYKSPMADSGYDITDYYSVNPIFGTMEDFDTLIREMNARGLKLMIDLVFNHCSDEHPWFNKSIHKEEPYTNYFVWKDPKGFDTKGNPIPPNNWLSVFTGSAWKWNDRRQQFYLRRFAAQQPDFNLRNKVVKDELKKVLKFWVEKGVAGFRFDAVSMLLEDEKFRDEPVRSPDIKIPFQYYDLVHIYTDDVPDTPRLMHEFRIYLEKITRKYRDFERLMITENYADGELLYQYYGSEKYRIAHLPLNFALTTIFHYENSSFYHNIINNYLRGLPEGATPNWNTENHDKGRKGFIFTEEYGFMLTAMEMMLPGAVYLYYGQEIGAVGSKIRPDQEINHLYDPHLLASRDSFRHPMPWDNSLNGGFSNNNKLYLPLDNNYWKVNVKRQKEEPHSYYQTFKALMNLRKTDTMKFGDFKSYVISTWVFGFTRTLQGHTPYVVIFNLGSETEFIDLYTSVRNLPEQMIVEVASPNSGYKIGDEVPSLQEVPKLLILRPSAVLVLGAKPPNVHYVIKTSN